METTKKPRKQRTVTKPYQKHKTEKKISVKHYLHTKVKGDKREDNIVYYPVYVRVTFNGETGNLRSVTGILMSIEEFEEKHQSELGLLREIKLLEYVIKNDYNIYKKYQILFDFKLNYLLQRFSFYDYSVSSKITKGLRAIISGYDLSLDLARVEVDIYNNQLKRVNSDDFSDFKLEIPGAEIDAYPYIDPYLYILAKEDDGANYDEVKKLHSNYIWLFSVHFERLCTNFDEELDSLPLTIADYESGLFEKYFRIYLKSEPEKCENLLAEIKKLMAV